MMRRVRNGIILLIAAGLIGGLAFKFQSPSGGKSSAVDSHGGGKHDEHTGEGGVVLPDTKLAAAGIELEKAGPELLQDGLLINGILQPNQETLVQVTPRFPA